MAQTKFADKIVNCSLTADELLTNSIKGIRRLLANGYNGDAHQTDLVINMVLETFTSEVTYERPDLTVEAAVKVYAELEDIADPWERSQFGWQVAWNTVSRILNREYPEPYTTENPEE